MNRNFLSSIFTARKLVAGAAGAGALALAVGLGSGSLSPAYAQTATPASTPSAAHASGANRQQALGMFLQRVASRLGVSEDQLKSAIVGAEKDAVNDRVASGTLTQDQANRLNERIDKAGPGLLPRLLAARRHHQRRQRAGTADQGANSQ